MPWDEEGTDYDEPKPGGDTHEDEFDDEYGEQQPKGDPDQARADELAAAFEADIKFWENQGSDNRQQDAPPAEPETSIFANKYVGAEDFTFDWATGSVARPLEDPNEVALSSHLSAPDPDDFDWADTSKQLGPPSPDKEVGPAVSLAEARDCLADELDYGPAPSFTDDVSNEPYAASAPTYDPATEFDSSISDRMNSSGFTG